MRYLIVTLFLFTLSCTTQKRIPQNVNRMRVVTPYSDSALYESALVFLDQEHFIVERSDEKRPTLVTDYKPVKHNSFIRLVLNIKGGTIDVRGEGQIRGRFNNFDNVELNTSRGINGWAVAGFYAMDDIVRTLSRRLPGSTYEYAKR